MFSVASRVCCFMRSFDEVHRARVAATENRDRIVHAQYFSCHSGASNWRDASKAWCESHRQYSFSKTLRPKSCVSSVWGRPGAAIPLLYQLCCKLGTFMRIRSIRYHITPRHSSSSGTKVLRIRAIVTQVCNLASRTCYGRNLRPGGAPNRTRMARVCLL